MGDLALIPLARMVNGILSILGEGYAKRVDQVLVGGKGETRRHIALVHTK